jgi:hypothetical protein
MKSGIIIKREGAEGCGETFPEAMNCLGLGNGLLQEPQATDAQTDS